MTWTHPGAFRYPHKGGLQTPDVVVLVALVAQNDFAGAIPATAHSAMDIGASVEAIRVQGAMGYVLDLPLYLSNITSFQHYHPRWTHLQYT